MSKPPASLPRANAARWMLPTLPPQGLTARQADALGAFASDPAISTPSGPLPGPGRVAGVYALLRPSEDAGESLSSQTSALAARPSPSEFARLTGRVRRIDAAASERGRQVERDLDALRGAVQASKEQSAREHERTRELVRSLEQSVREALAEADSRTSGTLRQLDGRRVTTETFVAAFAKTVEARQTRLLAAAKLLSPRGLIALFLTLVVAHNIGPLALALWHLYQRVRPESRAP